MILIFIFSEFIFSNHHLTSELLKEHCTDQLSERIFNELAFLCKISFALFPRALHPLAGKK